MTNENSVIAYKCYNLLRECIDVDNIENKIFVKNNLNRIKKYRTKLSNDIYSNITLFINVVIDPILEDDNYFDFLQINVFFDVRIYNTSKKNVRCICRKIFILEN